MNFKLQTIREACAREIEWMARGHVAHEHVVLDIVVERIRAIDLMLTTSATDIVEAAHEVIMHVRGEQPDMFRHCLDYAVAQLEEIKLNDPMKPFSDSEKWWPRAKEKSDVS